MKTLVSVLRLFLLSLSASLSLSAFAAGTHPGIGALPGFVRPVLSGDSVRSSLSVLLDRYYEIKDALANDDAAATAKNAGAFLKTIDGIDPKTLPAAEGKLFLSLKDKLSYDSRHMSEVQMLPHQREHFASLSLNMIALAKGARLSAEPVYKDYCPMKKVYWLSGDAVIRNPYYGKEMPTCGSIKETIK
jgi:hypothetical protein